MSDPVQIGESADAIQAQKEREATARPRGHLTPVAELLGGLAEARAAWERRRASVLESDCPECEVDSARAKVCWFRGQECCKYASELQRRGRVKTLETNLRVAHAPEDLWGRILEGRFENRAAIAAARRIVADEGKLAIFAGGPGAGKTLGLALALAERGGWFQSASGLDPFGKETNELLEHCADVSLLGLDDAGAGRSISDVARARFEQLVCARWDRGLPTIVTTNLTRPQFWPLYGGPLGRVADRLSSDPVGWVSCLEDGRRKVPR